jgi:glycosyltransferase involved in cell wall biosynthesis
VQPLITIVIPAWNEEDRIAETLLALRGPAWKRFSIEIIVVDDGSQDDTFQQASRWTERVIRHPKNLGKGRAMETGWRAGRGQIFLFLDADLGASAEHAWKLIVPITDRQADMAIAILPPAQRKGGFGFVKGLASAGIYRLSGYHPSAPLSGQRAILKRVLEHIGGLSYGFGIEVGLTIDAARKGYRILEVEVPFQHRETGRNWSGFLHRGKQFIQVGRTLIHKWRETV